MSDADPQEERYTFEPYIDVTKRFDHQISAPSGVFSTGEWKVLELPLMQTKGTFGFCLSWKGVRSAVGISLELALYDAGGKRLQLHPLLPNEVALLLPRVTFPDHKTGYQTWRLEYDRATTAYARLTCTTETSSPNLGVVANLTSLRTLHPNKVRFFFPSSNRELFANAEVLKAASPYFATLLGPDCAEGRNIAPADRKTITSHSVDGTGMADSFNDLDEEDSVVDGEAQTGKTEEGPLDCNTLFHVVVVKEFAWETHEAVLLYLTSGEIEFCPNPSSATRFTTSSEVAEQSALALPLTGNTSILLSVSPKSVYRLAQLLSLPELSQLALEVFQEQLTVDNIVLEFFTNFSAVSSEVADVVIDFAVEHWKEVKESSAMKDLVQASEKEGGEIPSGVALKLMLRLA